MVQLITEPTRVTETSKTLIDVIMMSNQAFIADSGVVKMHSSDHHLTYAVLNLKLPKPPPDRIIVRSDKHYDPNSFMNSLAEIP